ncbi:MAG: YdcF family protein [Clostridiales bacterium]
MKMLLRTLMIVLGSLFVLEIVVLAFMSNFNAGWILTVFMGLFFISYGVFFEQINGFMSSGVLLIIRYIGYGLLIFLFATIGFLAIYGNVDNVSADEDAVIVLGAGLRGDRVSLTLAQRLNAAYDYWQRNPNSLIVVTGGQGPQETVPEAQAMAKYLVAKGVPQTQIIEEDKSTSTAKNFGNAKKILDDKFGEKYSVAYVTNAFHIYRAGQIAEDQGLNATHYHAGLSWYMTPVVYFREFAAVLNYWIGG